MKTGKVRAARKSEKIDEKRHSSRLTEFVRGTRRVTLSLLVGFIALALGAPAARAAGVTDEDILNDTKATTDVVSYGMGPHQHRFSPLDQINTTNIGKLVPAWSFSFGGEKQRGQETQPLVYKGKIFVTGSYSRMWAVDAASGQKIWEYNHRLPEGILPCCDVINRGAALYGDLAIFGTLDGQLVALNQDTGKVVWRETIGDYSAGVSITHTPIIVKGKVLVAIAGSEFGVSGKVEARDALTGKLVWSRPTIEGGMGTLNGQDSGVTGTLNATWPGDTWKTGGGAAWNGGTWDKAGAMFHKNGFFYVNDRKTGKLLSATPFVNKITWASSIDVATGRPVETGNRPGDPAQSPDGKKGTTVWVVPNFLGGKNWNPVAYSEDTGLFYVPANEWGMDIWNEPIVYKKGAAYLGAGFTIKPVYDDYIGALRAIEPATGKIVWEYHDPGTLWGGVLATHGGLVFTGTPEGYLKAFDAKTGKELWKFNTGSGVIGSPITFEMDGEQYIVVASGWGGAPPLWGGEVAKKMAGINQGGSLWAFKLLK